MTIETKTWTCSRCSQEFNGPGETIPPGWVMRRGRLICADCSGPTPTSAPRPKPTPLEHCEAVAA